ncbi:MAG: V-type ATP synthase subunit E family protein [Candidatus Helarchaeota archaeon]
MPTIKEGITAITEELNDTIQKEIKDILDEAEKEKIMIIEESKKRAETKIRELKKETEKIIEKEKRRIESLIILETRRNKARLKDKVIKEAFKKIKDKLRDYVHSAQYLDTLHAYINQAIKDLVELIKKQDINSNISLILRLNQTDTNRLPKEWLKEFENKFKIQVEIGSPIQTIGGLIIETTDGTISYDNTFEGRLNRKKIQIRAKIASILFPEEQK